MNRNKITALCRAESWDRIQGLVNDRHRQIIDALRELGTLTPREYADAIGAEVHAVRPRFTELLQGRVLVSAGKSGLKGHAETRYRLNEERFWRPKPMELGLIYATGGK